MTLLSRYTQPYQPCHRIGSVVERVDRVCSPYVAVHSSVRTVRHQFTLGANLPSCAIVITANSATTICVYWAVHLHIRICSSHVCCPLSACFAAFHRNTLRHLGRACCVTISSTNLPKIGGLFSCSCSREPNGAALLSQAAISSATKHQTRQCHEQEFFHFLIPITDNSPPQSVTSRSLFVHFLYLARVKAHDP